MTLKQAVVQIKLKEKKAYLATNFQVKVYKRKKSQQYHEASNMCFMFPYLNSDLFKHKTGAATSLKIVL